MDMIDLPGTPQPWQWKHLKPGERQFIVTQAALAANILQFHPSYPSLQAAHQHFCSQLHPPPTPSGLHVNLSPGWTEEQKVYLVANYLVFELYQNRGAFMVINPNTNLQVQANTTQATATGSASAPYGLPSRPFIFTRSRSPPPPGTPIRACSPHTRNWGRFSIDTPRRLLRTETCPKCHPPSDPRAFDSAYEAMKDREWKDAREFHDALQGWKKEGSAGNPIVVSDEVEEGEEENPVVVDDGEEVNISSGKEVVGEGATGKVRRIYGLFHCR
ncbi:hypothetical protein GQ43DRAFT_431737 [Delitschia confertaspora ATCC 74209]|uniref:Uncharacterized protein n=1 Tax=Delitschia confertaspora ATCC 74209 TaxID=1513339 RepID=A0A9P4MYX8_9PLEO|nr:hypothetical protein GQ43DRAFT_431737 [Delitschia confertaspora ATCC 74209]